jgi:hypothetical protein
MNELGRATATLYEAFHGYPLKTKIEGCPHCKLDAAEASLTGDRFTSSRGRTGRLPLQSHDNLRR